MTRRSAGESAAARERLIALAIEKADEVALSLVNKAVTGHFASAHLLLKLAGVVPFVAAKGNTQEKHSNGFLAELAEKTLNIKGCSAQARRKGTK